VPGVDFGPHGEGFVRFCFARERTELEGALAGMKELFTSAPKATTPLAETRT
jgi:aspartate/methionine/tyrosine aminotransferase